VPAAGIVLARSAPFRLGKLRVSPPTLEVTGPGLRERLEPRVMQVLVALAKAEGAIVSRDELIDACWGGRIVGDDALNRVVGRIRRVAESAGEGAFRLETINKVGYRLLDGAAEPAAVASQSSRVSRRTLLIGGAALAAGGAFSLARDGDSLPPETASLIERGLAASRRGNAESTAEAVGFLQEAVRLSPDSARAWGALALAYYGSQHFLDASQVQRARDRSRAAAGRAIALDRDDAAAHAALALAIAPYGNWLAAESALRQVLALDPMQFEARLTLSRLLANVGRTRAAVSTLEPLARQAEAQPVVHYVLAFLYWQSGRVAESDRLLDRAIARWPRNYQIWFSRFWQRVYSGRPSEALDMSARAALRPIGIPDWNFALIELSARAVLTRSQPDIGAALTASAEAARRGAGFAENAIELASELGALDQAYTVADAYYFGRGFAVGPNRYSAQQGSFTRPARRETKHLFSPSTSRMRADPRFAALTAEIGLPAYWRAAGAAADTALPRPA
jgi:DNA-binding winged helix-turn-helix (wHTH) protein/tetratricopeptide (TPR) repeat protein